MLSEDKECEIVAQDKVNVAVKNGHKLQKLHTNRLTAFLDLWDTIDDRKSVN